MSLFGSMMGDLEEDPIFGHHMRSMRQMNNMMNSLFADPFGGMFGNMESIAGPALGGGRNAMMPFFPQVMPMNRLLNPVEMPQNSMSYSSSSVYSMSSGPDGPQVYQATSSTRTGPGGIKEVKKTVQDSRTGTKKMAIGHHIGERAHIIEREQNLHTNTQEENQEYINLEEEEAEDFNREFHHKARSAMSLSGRRHVQEQLALPSNQPNSSQLQITNSPHNRRQSQLMPRRTMRSPTSSPLALPPSTSSSSSSNHITTRWRYGNRYPFSYAPGGQYAEYCCQNHPFNHNALSFSLSSNVNHTPYFKEPSNRLQHPAKRRSYKI